MSTSDRATFFPTLPPPTMITYTSCSSLHGDDWRVEVADVARAHSVGKHRDRGLRGAHRAQAALGVEVRAQRVEHANDDAADPVALLEHLCDDDVRVVAVRGDDSRISLVDAGVAQHLAVHRVADDEPTTPG